MELKRRKKVRIKNHSKTKELFSFRKGKKLFSSFLSAWLLISSCFHPAYGMTEEDWKQHNWNHLFCKSHINVPLGSHILSHLNTRSLVKAARVSQGWKALVQKTQDERYILRSQGKAPLFKALLEAVGAEADEVTRVWHILNLLMESSDIQGQAAALIKQKLMKMKPRLLQPEALILRDEKERFLHCVAPDKSHPALRALVQVIKDLEELEQDPHFKQLKPENLKVFLGLKAHYETYLETLLQPMTDRVAFTQPKVIFSGEGLIGANPYEIFSYRISQEMALSLLSKDRYGLFLKHNALGSHAVKKQGEVYFKGNTTSTGLPVGRESATYWFAQILFGESLTPTSLLTLNEVEIKTPREQTQAGCDYALALATGKTSSEFFTLHPQHQEAFTQKNPHHILQASLSVTGLSLEDFMKGVESRTYQYEDLDLNSFSELIFISLLTNPSDGTPGNFMVRTNQGKPYALVGIDNDMAFGPSIVLTKRGKDKAKQDIFKPNLEVKNVLYCLPLMDEPLSVETRDRILSTSPQLFLLNWLERLKIQQHLYDKLKSTGYAKEDKCMPYLKGTTYAEELHLPLCFPSGLLTTLLEDFTKLQTKIKSRTSLTHSQLLSFFQPLVHRFYMALKHKYPTPLAAYQVIHNSNFENMDLEDILQPHKEEVLASGQTLGQALREVSLQGQNQVQSKAQTLDQSAQEIWKAVDLNAQSRIVPFLELAALTFPFCFQDKTAPHPSWLNHSLLLRALKEGASHNVIGFLLNTLNLKAHVRDPQTQQNVMHCAIQKKSSLAQYPPSLLTYLLDLLSVEEPVNLLKGLDSSGLSPLDYAMERDDISSFLTLIARGAKTCSASMAVKFYKRMIKDNTKQNTSLHAAFRKLMVLNGEVEWRIALEELLPPLSSKKEDKEYTLTSCTYGERELPLDIKNQIINVKGDFITISTTGSRPVAYAQNKGLLKTHGLYFKFYPALPGLEEAAGSFTHSLLGYGTPFTDLVKIAGAPCLISQEIPGETLQRTLETQPHVLNDLDEEDISGMLMAAMLTNPEDGKPDNYVVTPHPIKPRKYRVIGIDNDQVFVPAIVKETPDKTLWTKKIIPIAQVKTILYCLDQMKNPIHPTWRATLINTHPDRFLEEWLRGLKRVNNQHCGLFTGPEQTQVFQKYNCFIGVPFQEGAVRHIYEKFVHLRDLLTLHPTLTHIELLNKLEPRLAKRYQAALIKTISVRDRFREVDRPFYEVKTNNQKGESHTTVTQSGDILQSMGIPLQEKIFDSIRLGKEKGPVQALEELETIKKEKNRETLKSLSVRVGDINLLKTLTLEGSRVLFLKELERQKKTLSLHNQVAVLEYLAQQKSIRELILPNFFAMDDTLFQKISFEHLRKVDLRKCEKVTYRSLSALSQKALALEELNLSYNPHFKEIGDLGTFVDAPLLFKELRFLNLEYCSNLTKLLIQALKLHYLNIGNCAYLTDQMLDSVIEGNLNLQKLMLEGCPLITEKELREKFPFYPVSRNLQCKEAMKRILKSENPEIDLNDIAIDSESFKFLTKALNSKAMIKTLLIQNHNLDLPFMRNVGSNLLLQSKNLTGLKLQNSNISEEELISFSNPLSNHEFLTKIYFHNLTRLYYLSENFILPKNLSALVITQCPVLTGIDLSASSLHSLVASACKDLWSVKIDKASIRYLDLRDNPLLSNDSVEKILESQKNLQTVDVTGCKEVFLPEIRNKNFRFPLKHFKKLDLPHALTFCRKLLPDFEARQPFVNLDFENENIYVGEMKTLVDVLELIQRLTNLTIQRGKICNDGINILDEFLKKNHSLTSLTLQNCNITDDNAKILAQSLEEKAKLIFLNIEGNMIGNEGANALAKIPSLTSLNLSHNIIKNANNVFLQLLQNSQLQTLNFSNAYKLFDNELKQRIATKKRAIERRKSEIREWWAAAGLGLGGALGALSIGPLGYNVGIEGAGDLVGGMAGVGAEIGTIIGTAIGTMMLVDLFMADDRGHNAPNLCAWLLLIAGGTGILGAYAFTLLGIGSMVQTVVAKGGILVGIVGGTVGIAGGGLVGGGAGLITGGLVGATVGERRVEPIDSASIEDSLKKELGMVGSEEVKALSKNTILTALDLSNNCITDEIASSIASHAVTLRSLNLTCNKIGDEGTKALVNGNLTNLTHLNLNSNNIKNEGAHALANCNLPSLTRLDLWNNTIGDKEKEALKVKFGNKVTF